MRDTPFRKSRARNSCEANAPPSTTSRISPFAPGQDSPSLIDPARPQKFRNARPPRISRMREAKVDADATAIGDIALSGP